MNDDRGADTDVDMSPVSMPLAIWTISARMRRSSFAFAIFSARLARASLVPLHLHPVPQIPGLLFFAPYSSFSAALNSCSIANFDAFLDMSMTRPAASIWPFCINELGRSGSRSSGVHVWVPQSVIR